jgi:hypothetical protein
MKFLIFSEDNNYLVFDSLERDLYWSKNKPSIDADRKTLQSLLNNKMKLQFPSNIQIKNLNPDQITVFENKLKFKTLMLGEISTEIKKYEIENLKKNGGAVLIYFSEINDQVIKVIPNYISSVKSDIRNTNNVNNGNSDYIEAVVKIPKISHIDNETLGRMMDSNIQIYKKVTDINLKLDYLQNYTNNLLNHKEFEREKDQLLSRINQLEKNNEMLIRERALFEREIKNAEQTALIRIKDELNSSIAAINRIVDLDDYDFKAQFYELVEQIQTLNGNSKNNKKTKKVEKSSDVVDFIDNLEAKIQSLKEIKKEFVKLNLLKD